MEILLLFEFGNFNQKYICPLGQKQNISATTVQTVKSLWMASGQQIKPCPPPFTPPFPVFVTNPEKSEPLNKKVPVLQPSRSQSEPWDLFKFCKQEVTNSLRDTEPSHRGTNMVEIPLLD